MGERVWAGGRREEGATHNTFTIYAVPSSGMQRNKHHMTSDSAPHYWEPNPHYLYNTQNQLFTGLTLSRTGINMFANRICHREVQVPLWKRGRRGGVGAEWSRREGDTRNAHQPLVCSGANTTWLVAQPQTTPPNQPSPFIANTKFNATSHGSL